MSDQASSSAEPQSLEGLARRIDELEGYTAALTASMKQAVNIRLSLFLLVLALLGVVVSLFYSKVNGFTSNLDPVIAELERKAQENSDTVMIHAQTLFNNTQPTVSAAFADQFEKDFSDYMDKIEEEWQTLGLNLQSRLEGLVDTEYRRTIANHRGILEEEFPDLKDPVVMGTMVAHFQDGLRPLVKQHYGDRLVAELERMANTLDDFPLSETEGTPDELADELYGHLWELFVSKMTELQPAEQQRASRSGS